MLTRRSARRSKSQSSSASIPRHLKVYPADVRDLAGCQARSSPSTALPDILSIPAEDMLANAKWHTIGWRTGTKGKLKARFAASGAVADDHTAIRTKASNIYPGRGLAYRRTQMSREILSRQPAARQMRPWQPPSRRVDCERLTSIKNSVLPLRGRSCKAFTVSAYDMITYAPPASPLATASGKKINGRRLSQLCPPYDTPSSNCSLHYRHSDARIVENGFATSGA